MTIEDKLLIYKHKTSIVHNYGVVPNKATFTLFRGYRIKCLEKLLTLPGTFETLTSHRDLNLETVTDIIGYCLDI